MKWMCLFFILTVFAVPIPLIAQEQTQHTTALDSSNLIEVSNIFITGNKKTKNYIIERELTFKQGQIMVLTELEKRMEESTNNLKSAALFVETNVFVSERHQDKLTVTVAVRERWYFFPLPYFKLIDRNFNEWWVEHNRSLERVNYGLKLLYYNASGRRDNLAVNVISGYSPQIMLRYDQPYADKKLQHGFGVNLLYAKQKEIAYTTVANKLVSYKGNDFLKETFRFDLNYYYRPAIKSLHNFRISYVNENLSDTLSVLNPNFSNGVSRLFFPEISYRFNYVDVDYKPYPNKGWLAELQLLKRGLNSEMNLWQFTGKAAYTMPIFYKSYLHLQAAGILNLPFDQPYYNTQLFGKEYYLRGQEYFVVDGYAGLIGRATARKEVLSFVINNPIKIRSLEKIPFRFMLKAYGDLGYAFSENNYNNSMLNNTLLKTWGAGVDIITLYDIVLRIEYSFNQFKNQGLFLHSKDDF